MFYGNHTESSYQELIRYYPKYYRYVAEMLAILNAYGSIIDRFRGDVEITLSNAFIDDADEKAVERLESFFALNASGKTLAERRRQIKMCYAGYSKVSSSFLKNMLSTVVSREIDITFEPFDEDGNNRLNVLLDGTDETIDLDEVINILNHWIPAHLQFFLCLSRTTSSRITIGIASQQSIVRTTVMNPPDLDQITVLVDENGDLILDGGDVLIITRGETSDT